MYVNDLDAPVGLGIIRAELPEAVGGVGNPHERTEGSVSIYSTGHSIFRT